MREIRLYGSEGGGAEYNRFFLPLSYHWRTPSSRLIRLKALRAAKNYRPAPFSWSVVPLQEA